MCGRFTLTTDPGVVARRFGAPPTQGGGTTPRYNVAPTQTVVTVTAEGERHLEQMRWGLVPRWAKSPEIGNRLINARAETLAEKPAFRDALRRRRALIPADGFYEWVTLSGPSGQRQPGASPGASPRVSASSPCTSACARASRSPSPACGRSGRPPRAGPPCAPAPSSPPPPTP